jgi:hypothetical protein
MVSHPIIQGPLVWDGSIEASPELFTLTLEKEDQVEINTALEVFKCKYHVRSLPIYQC